MINTKICHRRGLHLDRGALINKWVIIHSPGDINTEGHHLGEAALREKPDILEVIIFSIIYVIPAKNLCKQTQLVFLITLTEVILLLALLLYIYLSPVTQ